jgi:hypothetical protein
MGLGSNLTHQIKKQVGENLPPKESAWACLLGKNGALLETLETRFLAIT